MANITALNKELHRNMTISHSKNYAHAKDQHILPVVVHEFASLCVEFPIVYVKNSDTGQFQAVAVMGFEPGENLYVGENQWDGVYVPACLRNYPLRLVNDKNDGKSMMVAVDEESPLVGEGGDNRLFDDEGQDSEFLKKSGQSMIQYVESAEITKAFINLLSEADLLVQKNLSVEINSKPMSIGGIYTVDESKLNELSEEKFSDLRKRGFLGPLYAQMISLNQVPRLAQLKAKRSN